MRTRCIRVAALWAILLCGRALLADATFHVEEATLLTGSTNQEISLLCDNDFAPPDDPVHGFSFGLTYDPTLLSVSEVTSAGTVAEGASFFGGRVDDVAGDVGYGCVFGYETIGDTTLPVGTDLVLAKLIVDVEATEDTTATLTWETVQVWDPPAPGTKNVLSVDGVSIDPTLVNGTVIIETRAPVITSIDPDGGMEGDSFEITGEHFDETGLAVTVCGNPADATLLGDGVTIEVTAPGCGQEGWAEVEVCTDRGCDSVAEGFEYIPDVQPATFIRGDADGSGGARALDLTDGIRILNFLFLGGPPAGCRDVMDADDNGKIELTDGVRIFSHLFTGGPPPPAPYPDCGVDPQGDEDGIPCAVSWSDCDA